jgi:S-adenosylmethionine-dependent methyltransferase
MSGPALPDLGEWLEWQQTPWGRLRYTLAADRLARHVPAGTLMVADVGGGNGLDSIRLAQQGHCVTLIDQSDMMLAEAERATANLGLDGCFDTVRAGIGALSAVVEVGSFDVVLCHNVLQFVDDLDGAVTELVSLLKPAGVLSLMCPNRDSEPLRLAVREHDLAGALAAVGATRMANHLYGTDTRALCAGDLIDQMERNGIAETHHYGIRAVSDYVVDDSIKFDSSTYAALEQLERVMGEREPYRSIARMTHVIGIASGPAA